MMRILVVGSGRVGAHVLRQLQKNPSLKIITCDPHQEPFAVKEGIISGVDIQEALTPLNLAYVIEQAEPDLILLTMTSTDFGLGKVPGVDMMVESLKKELSSISKVPLIEVARALG
jgi:nucleoside-diphosphate-sugar epimerase